MCALKMIWKNAWKRVCVRKQTFGVAFTCLQKYLATLTKCNYFNELAH